MIAIFPSGSIQGVAPVPVQTSRCWLVEGSTVSVRFNEAMENAPAAVRKALLKQECAAGVRAPPSAGHPL